jgi:hypothetical protein
MVVLLALAALEVEALVQIQTQLQQREQQI